MKPTAGGTKRKELTIAVAVLVGVVALTTFGLSANATHQPNHADTAAVITVVFTPNDMGFEAISSKDLSNIIVQYCNLTYHKHDNLDVKVYNHTETSIIRGVWVKSGDNGIAGNDPSGAGAFFVNADACGVVITTSTTIPGTTVPNTTAPSTTAPNTTVPGTTAPTTTVPTTTAPSDPGPSTTAPNTTSTAPTTEIPFFPSATALALAAIGAASGAFVLLRRKN